jgi:hypothetical protein
LAVLTIVPPLAGLRIRVRRTTIPAGLIVHIMKLLTHVSSSPKYGDQEPAYESVQKVAQYEKDKNIHGQQIY